MNVGAPHSPARWLSENIDSIPTHHTHALIGMDKGNPVLVTSGTKAECAGALTDGTRQTVCELDKYRAPLPASGE